MSEISLEKLDVVIDRTGATYKEAKDALVATNGDVVDAIISIEQKQLEFENKVDKTREDIVNKIKCIIKKGNVARIKVKNEDKTLVDIPVNVGLITTGIAYYIFPLLIPAGIVVATLSSLTFEITKTDGSVEVVNEIVKSTYNDVKDKAQNYSGTAKDKFDEYKSVAMDKFNEVSEGFKDKFNNLVSDDVKDKIANITDKAKEKINEVIDEVSKAQEKMANKNKENDVKSYTSYTVKFDEEDKDKEDSESSEEK